MDGLSGTLWKRASKVHIAQAADDESGHPRDWVTRHFRLLPAEGTLAYFQKESDSSVVARGVVPLACYDGVGDAEAPPPSLSTPPTSPSAGHTGTPDSLHAFQLTAADGNPDRAFVVAAQTA